MQTSLIIIDDFLANPHEFREAALKLDYPRLDKPTYFPGRNSEKRVRLEGVDEVVGRIIGEKLTPTPGTGYGKFRIALEDDVGEGDIHIDESHWSGILYLNLPEQCRGGTEFFRHIPTNSERAPINTEELRAMGFASAQELWDNLIKAHSKDRSK